MKPTWKWGEGEVRIEVGPRAEVFKLAPAKFSEVNEFSGELELAKQVQLTLQSAFVSFQGGRAVYEGARKNVEDLILEFSRAKAQYLACLQGVSAFFEPAGLEKLFADPRDLEAFAADVLQVLRPAPEEASS